MQCLSQGKTVCRTCLLCMPSMALDKVAKHLLLVFEFCEVFCGIEGQWEPVGDCKAPFLGCSLPMAGPCCLGGGSGSV